MAISYGAASRGHIAQLDGRLQTVLYRYADVAPAALDLSIIDSFRDEARQNAAYAAGRSKVQWPNSKHNRHPALAFDFIPYPFTQKDWNDLARFARIAGGLQLVAASHRIPIRWGGDFSGDGRTIDERFIDAGHIELLG